MNGDVGGGSGDSGDDNTVVILAIVCTSLVIVLVSCGIICLLYSKDNKVAKPIEIEVTPRK